MLDRVRIVLVQPQHPGNVGAAARAMQNMGLGDLAVVDPPCFDPETARWLAPGCDEMLTRVGFHADLPEALKGCQQVIASTARHRKQNQPVLTPEELADQIATRDGKYAILFGREDFGLSTEHTLYAESILRIPTPEHASLNLAQAVLLVSHALFERARQDAGVATGRMLGGSRGRRSTAAKSRGDRRDRPADVPLLEPAVDELIELLGRVGYFRGTPEDKVRLTARQALQRGRVTVRHVEALRGMVNRVKWALDNPEYGSS